MGLVAAAEAVVELGYDAVPEQGTETSERARALGNGDREQRLAGLAELGSFGHEPQPVEVHVGAAQHRHQLRAVQAVLVDPPLEARHAQGSRRLDDAAGVVEHVLDGGADLVVGDRHHVVDHLLGQREGVATYIADRHPVGEDPDLFERYGVPGGQRAGHPVGLDGLDADHLDRGNDGLEVGTDSGYQSTATDRYEHGVDAARATAHDFVGDGALPGDHQRVVEGVDKGPAGVGRDQRTVGLSVAEAVSREDHVGPEGLHGVDLDLGGGLGHDDQRVQPQVPGGVGDPLSVVARTGGDYPFRHGLGRQTHHLVVGAADLEAEDRLKVFALEQHPVVDALGQTSRRLERGFDGDVVDPTGEDGSDDLVETAHRISRSGPSRRARPAR